jgi:surfeit locus 1 family protein
MSAPRRFLVVTMAALAVALLTARLGLWQLSRAAEKATLQAAIDERSSLPPLAGAAALPADPAALEPLIHRRIELDGHWVPPYTVFLDNRQMEGRPGFYVVTPLVLRDGRAVLVQRGWVARDPVDRTRVDAPGLPEGEVRVAGRIAPPPARLYEFAGEDGGRIRQNLDLAKFAQETRLRLLPLSLLQTDPASSSPGLVRDWPAPATGIERHYGYAAQWFALSALVIILYVWFQFIQPRRARRA